MMANQSRRKTAAAAVLLLLVFKEMADMIAQALSPADPFIRHLIRMVKKKVYYCCCFPYLLYSVLLLLLLSGVELCRVV